jgi:hypothetical protein
MQALRDRLSKHGHDHHEGSSQGGRTRLDERRLLLTRVTTPIYGRRGTKPRTKHKEIPRRAHSVGRVKGIYCILAYQRREKDGEGEVFRPSPHGQRRSNSGN